MKEITVLGVTSTVDADNPQGRNNYLLTIEIGGQFRGRSQVWTSTFNNKIKGMHTELEMNKKRCEVGVRSGLSL